MPTLLQIVSLAEWKAVPERAVADYYEKEAEIKAAFEEKSARNTLERLGEAINLFPGTYPGGIPNHPSPLASMLTGGIAGAGLGYGAGVLGEAVLPASWKRGRLRRTLALLGGALGASPGLAAGLANKSIGDNFNSSTMLQPGQEPIKQTPVRYGVKDGGIMELLKESVELLGKRGTVVKTANIGGYPISIDRPKGHLKTFQTPNGPVEKAYPVDYGYFNNFINPDDNEELDIFRGSGGPHRGRFMKGKNLSGKWEPDERKWYSDLTDDELEAVKTMFTSQSPDLLKDFQSFDDEKSFLNDILTASGQKQDVEKKALLAGTGLRGNPIDVGQWNDMIWHDPRLAGPLRPPMQAAASGLITGAAALPGKSNTRFVTPFDMARMAAGMGSGWASGAIVGKVLGMAMGMPQATQERLKNTGVMAGLVANMVPLAFGR
jgi:hypothetical protein